MPETIRSTHGRRARSALIVLALTAAPVVAVASPAQASTGCRPPDGQQTTTTYTISKIDSPTTLHSSYIDGPATISRVESKETSKSAQIGGGVTGGLEFWIVKIGGDVNASLTKTWTTTGGYEYSKPVPAGKTARLMYYHRVVVAHVTQKAWYATTCSYHVTHRGDVSLPYKTSKYDVWRLQYK